MPVVAYLLVLVLAVAERFSVATSGKPGTSYPGFLVT